MTDHVWFNISYNLQNGLMEVLILQTVNLKPDTCSGIAERICDISDIWVDSLGIQNFMLHELRYKVTLKDGVYHLTANGEEFLHDSLVEIAKFQSLYQQESKVKSNE